MTEPEPLAFLLSAHDYDVSQLPNDCRVVGTERFKPAVTEAYAEEFAPLGGRLTVEIRDDSAQAQTNHATSRASASRRLPWIRTTRQDLQRSPARPMAGDPDQEGHNDGQS
jgi:hypothetical protein